MSDTTTTTETKVTRPRSPLSQAMSKMDKATQAIVKTKVVRDNAAKRVAEYDAEIASLTQAYALAKAEYEALAPKV